MTEKERNQVIDECAFILDWLAAHAENVWITFLRTQTEPQNATSYHTLYEHAAAEVRKLKT